MAKPLKCLIAATALLWAGSAQALELTMVADLTYMQDDPDPATPPVIQYLGPQTIVLTGESWDDRFYLTEDASPSGCFQVQEWGMGCFIAEFEESRLNFRAPELGGFYQSFSISLTFDRNVETDRSLIGATLVSGSYDWSYGHHNGWMSVAGPINSLSVAEPSLSVPEPATWAMMLIGFGGIGSALRRSSRATRHLPA